MIDEETLAQMNGKYVMPPDAGPEWRAAVAFGLDMSLVEHSLSITPEQRFAEHQRCLELVLAIDEAREMREAHGAK